MADGGEVLETGGLSGVSLYEPGALTIVVQAGTPVAEIETTLAGENQRLAFEPMDHRVLLGSGGEPTIGGVISANVSGPRRLHSGAARDFALGIRMVDGGGNVLKNGGRVMKNVTGYDLVKLMCGARGSLGVISEVSLKVLPVPETEGTLALQGLAPERAVQALSAALGSPFDVTGAAHDVDAKRTLIRLEGFENSVRYRAEALLARLAAFADAEILTPEVSAKTWRDVRDVAAQANEPGDVWRVSVKPSDGPRVIDAAKASGALMDWGGGLVWLRVAAGTDLRPRLSGIPGHATLVRADVATRARLGQFAPETPAVAALSAGIRAKFDPRGILTPHVAAAA